MTQHEHNQIITLGDGYDKIVPEVSAKVVSSSDSHVAAGLERYVPRMNKLMCLGKNLSLVTPSQVFPIQVAAYLDEIMPVAVVVETSTPVKFQFSQSGIPNVEIMCRAFAILHSKNATDEVFLAAIRAFIGNNFSSGNNRPQIIDQMVLTSFETLIPSSSFENVKLATCAAFPRLISPVDFKS